MKKTIQFIKKPIFHIKFNQKLKLCFFSIPFKQIFINSLEVVLMIVKYFFNIRDK